MQAAASELRRIYACISSNERIVLVYIGKPIGLSKESSLLYEFITTYELTRFYWEWLPAFAGVRGRINELGGGEGVFLDSVFIGGDFSPPVLVWTNDADVGPSTRSAFFPGV